MNIFFLSALVKLAAQYHNNRHVVKMISETCHLLSTAWWALNAQDAEVLFKQGLIWKSTHAQHPCAVWARAYVNNYVWLASLGIALCDEFELRFSGAPHAARAKLEWLSANAPRSIPCTPPSSLHFQCQVTLPPQCMPEAYVVPGDPVAGYRQYYQCADKAKLRWWAPRSSAQLDGSESGERFVPEWFEARPLAAPKYFAGKRRVVAVATCYDRDETAGSRGKRSRIASGELLPIEVAQT